MFKVDRRKLFNYYLPTGISVVLVVAAGIGYLVFITHAGGGTGGNGQHGFYVQQGGKFQQRGGKVEIGGNGFQKPLLVSSVSVGTFNNSPLNVSTANYSVTKGNLLVVGCGSNSSSSSTPPTDTAGNTFAFANGAYESAVGNGIFVYYSLTTAGGATDVITCHVNTTNFVGIFVSQYSGIASTPLDASGNRTDFNSGNPTLTSSAFVPTQIGDLAVACFFDGNGSATFTAGSGYTLLAATANGVGICDYKQNIGTSSQSAAATYSPDYISKAMGVATFKAASSH